MAIARLQGLDLLGEITLIIMAASLVLEVHHNLITAPMMSIGAQYIGISAKEYFGTVALMQATLLASVLVALIVAAGVWSQVASFEAELYLSASFFVLTSLIMEFNRRVLFTLDRARRALFSDLARYAVQAIGIVTVASTALSHHALPAILAAMSLGCIAGAVAGWTAEARPRRASWSAFSEIVIRNWHFSKWVLLAGFARWGRYNVIFIAAKLTVGAEAVGVIRACMSVAGILGVITQALQTVLAIATSKVLASSGHNALRAYVLRATWKLAALDLMLTLPLLFFPDISLQFALGDTAGDYGRVLQLATLIFVVHGVSIAVANGLAAQEKTAAFFRGAALATLFVTVTSVPFGFAHGSLGVMISMVLAEILERAVWLRRFLTCHPPGEAVA